MASSELKEALKKAADTIAKYVEDAAEMSVETRYAIIGMASFDEAKLAARSVVKLDGDSETVLPMKQGATGVLEVDQTVYATHMQNVQAAIEYRHKILESLIGVLRGS